MNENHTTIRHPRPPRSARTLANALVTTILRSRWHRLRSDHLLLLTFIGRKSRRRFTTPVRYVQEGTGILQITVVYPWWRNLLAQPEVRVLLRGTWYSGNAEVLPEQAGEAIIRIHLHA